MITTTTEIYEFVEVATRKCREHGYGDIAQQFDDAMHLGSSGLEILGAIRAVCVAENAKLEELLGSASVHEVIRFVDRAFGVE